VRGAFGLLVGRLSSVQLRAELGAFVNAFGVSRTFSDEEERVYGPMFTVGLGY
jgi:hypothetical protein